MLLLATGFEVNWNLSNKVRAKVTTRTTLQYLLVSDVLPNLYFYIYNCIPLTLDEKKYVGHL